MRELGRFAVTIDTFVYRRTARAASEREAARQAEGLIRLLYDREDAISVAVEAPDDAATARIADYLETVVLEVADEQRLGLSAELG
jgi:hypothetical protein